MDVRRKSRDDKWVYFCQNSCLTSYSGCVDEYSSLTEQGISEFIRYGNPSLYEKLQGLQLPSSHLNSDGTEKKHGSLDEDMNQADNDPGAFFASSSDQLQAEEEERTEAFETARPPDANSASKAITEPHQKPSPVVESITLGRYLFTLFQHCQPDMIYCCSSPTCRFHLNVIPIGDLFGSVRDEALTGENSALTSDQRTVYYCLDCLQEVLDRELENNKVHEMLPQFMDGACDKKAILEWAEKMYPRFKESEFQSVRFPEESPPPPGTESNSLRTLRVRRQKQYDIRRIVRDVENEKLTDADLAELKKRQKLDPWGLRVFRPLHTEPSHEWYKKQGIEEHASSEGRRRTTRSSALPVRGESPKEVSGIAFTNTDRVCYCRELADENDEMIRCSSPFCMFGMIHLRCAGLDEAPNNEEEFLCVYCKPYTTMKSKKKQDESDAETVQDDSEEVIELETKKLTGDSDEMKAVPMLQHAKLSGFVAVNCAFPIIGTVIESEDDMNEISSAEEENS